MAVIPGGVRESVLINALWGVRNLCGGVGVVSLAIAEVWRGYVTGRATGGGVGVVSLAIAEVWRGYVTGRATGGGVIMGAAVSCGDGGGAGAVDVPAAWLVVSLPTSGYIGPVHAQLALLRGAAAVYSGGGLLIGGAKLIGPAGKVFAFASASSADMWAAINRARAESELSLMAGLDAAAAAVYRQRKADALAKISASVLTAAARQSDEVKRAALVVESAWCASKWGAA